MTAGPILARELLVSARSPRTYAARGVLAFAFLASVFGVYEGYRYYYGGRLSIQQVSALAVHTFLLVVAVQGVVTLMLVPQLVCGAIAREKDGKTLGFLLGTPLGSAEIVLGKLASRLIHFFAAMAVGVPILLLLSSVGGISPRAIGLVYAVTVSSAVTIGAVSILASTLCRGTKQAMRVASIAVTSWALLPVFFGLFGRFLSPGLYFAISWITDWIHASSPFFFTKNLFPILFGAGGRLAWAEDVARMVVLQVAITAVLLSLAVWRLRPVYRDQEGSERRTLIQRIRAWRWRLFRRPPVGDDPVYWRERHAIDSNGLAKLFGVMLGLVMVSAFAYFTASFAIPAFREVLGSGYGTSDVRTGNSYSGAEPSRLRFSYYIRALSPTIASVVLLLIASGVGASVPSEKDRDTWLGLIATPLSGREILRAKRLGSFFRAAPVIWAVFGLWLLGVVCGSLHPIGFLLGLALVAAWTSLAFGLGSFFSTRIAVTGNASGSAALILVLLWVFPPLFNIYEPFRSTYWGATCLPYLLFIALISNHNVDVIFGDGSTTSFASLGLFDDGPWTRGAWTVLFGILAPAIAGVLLIRSADSSFDRVIGRPFRPGLRDGGPGRTNSR